MRPLCLALVIAASAAACGPNYRYVYDGESAFERCYGLDYDSTATDAARAACWSAWLQSFSYGSNPDRVECARARLGAAGAPPQRAAAPTSAPPRPMTAPPTTGPMPAAAPTENAVLNAPLPEGAVPTAPPGWSERPSTSGVPVSPPPPTQRATQGAGDPPGAACERECRSAWSTAGGRCPRQDAACVARADESYRECMRGCF